MMGETPLEMVLELSFQNKHFQSHAELTRYVHDVSRKYSVPLSTHLSGISRTYQVYKCRYGGRVYGMSTAKTDCPCYLKYQRNTDNTFSLIEANWLHNHSTDRLYTESHCNCTSDELKEEIWNQQKLNIPPGSIRSNLDIVTTPDIFYNMRRNVIHCENTETLDDLISSMNNSEFSSIVTKDSNGNLLRASVLHKRVSQFNYSTDIMITDDTASTNLYDMKLQVSIVIDAENKSQVYSFGYLSGQSQNAYYSFFKEIKDMSQQQPRVIIVDRSQAQVLAIKEVYPDSYIVYCLRHLGKDLQKYFPKNSDIIIGFYDIQKNVQRCNDYLQLLISKLSQIQEESKGKQILKWMIENEENWMPLKLIQHGVIIEWTTNRCEGFFGMFKQRFGFRRFTLTTLTKNLFLQCRTMIIDSNNTIKKTINRYKDLDCVEPNDIPIIGKYALDIISYEMVEFLKDKEIETCKICALRNSCPDLALPCRHIMDKNILISAKDLNQRYIREDISMIKEGSHMINSAEPTLSSEYSDIMSQISPFASIANRNAQVREILEESISKLKATLIENEGGMPPTLSIKGKLSMHPSKNVILGGHPKTKRVYKCSICGQTGHNKSRHAFLQEHN